MSEPQRMVLQFPPDAPPILQTICVYDGDELLYTYHVSSAHTIKFTMHTPDGDFRYIVDNAAKTFTTESDKPFLA